MKFHSKSKNSLIKQQPQQQTIPYRQPIYLSIKPIKIFFTQGSILGTIIDRWNSQLKQNTKQSVNNDRQNKLGHTNTADQYKRTIFFLQVYQVRKNNLQKLKLSETVSIGQFYEISSTTKLYEYPINLTEINLKCRQQLSAFVYDFSPDQHQELMLKINVKGFLGQKITIGECRIDLNLLISMLLDDGIACVGDNKQIFKRIRDNKQIYQNIQLHYQVYSGRDRVNLQRLIAQNKRGIKVVDFKEQIRKILQGRQLQERLNQNVDVTSKYSKQVYLNRQPTHTESAKNKYKSFLNRNVQSKLEYFNPQKQLIQYQLKLMSSRKSTLGNKNRLPQNGQVNGASSSQKCKINSHQLQGNARSHSAINHQTNDFNKKGQAWNVCHKFRLVGFIIIAGILLYFSMIPSRKTQEKPAEDTQFFF